MDFERIGEVSFVEYNDSSLGGIHIASFTTSGFITIS